MSEKEKAVLESFLKAVHKVDDPKKEYLLGLADGIALISEGKKKSKRKPKPNQV